MNNYINKINTKSNDEGMFMILYWHEVIVS